MRLLIPPFLPATGAWGGLAYVIGIVEAAERAGYSVGFCAPSGYLEATLQRRGYRVHTISRLLGYKPLGYPVFLSIP
jgi:hypothetical protein